MPSISVIGGATTTINGLDSTEKVVSDTLSQVNNSAQLAAAAAGVFAAVAPLTAVTAGYIAADVQIQKLISDHQSGASTTQQLGDVVTLIGDVAIIGGGLSSYVGASAIGELFGTLGAVTDVTSVTLNNLDMIASKVESVETAISSVGSSALNSIGNYLSDTLDSLNKLAVDPPPSADPVSGIDSTQDQTLATIANTVGIASVSAIIVDPSDSPTVMWTDTSGGSHAFLSAPNVSLEADNGSIDVAPGIIENIGGSSSTTQIIGNSGTTIGVSGQNQIVTGDTGNDVVNIGGDGTSATVSGGGSTAMLGSYESLTLTDSGSGVGTGANAIGEAITENNGAVYMGSGSTGNLYGSGDTVQFTGNSGDYIGLHGQNETVTNDGGSNLVNLVDAGTSASISGGGNIGLTASNESLSLGDDGSSIQTASGLQNETITASGTTITLAADVQVTITGSNDTINGFAGEDNITINGSDNTFGGTDDQVDLEGDPGTDIDVGTNDSYFLDGIYAGGSDPSGGFDDPGDPGDGYGDDDDPLVLNLHGGSVQTVSAAQSPARFDFHDDGKSVKTGWGTPGEGYLVDAADGQTTVGDGRDLVSSFMSLQKLDSNHDDRIDARDAHWSDLKVWVDDTGTAAFQAGSLRSLSDLGITSIDLDPTPDRHRQNGNLILSEGTFTRADGSTGQIADVDFRTAAGGADPQTARAPIAAANLQASAQAAQLVSAMSTFGAEPAAETSIQGSDRPALIPMGVEASHPAHRHAA